MKRAFTLIELLVYIAILGFIIVVAGRVFSDSTVMRVRSQSMVKTSEEVGSVSNLIKEDLSQMGVKALGQANSSSNNSSSSNAPYKVYNVGKNNPKIYWSASSTPGAGDSSSYALVHRQENGNFFDSIIFRKADFDTAGRFIGVREISWAANSKTGQLLRRCSIVEKVCTDTPCGTDNDSVACDGRTAVIMTEKISNFKIIPSKPGLDDASDDVLFEGNFYLLSNNYNGATTLHSDSIKNTGIVTTVVGPFAQNNSPSEKKHNMLYLSDNTTSCKSLKLKKKETYVIEFGMPYSDDNSTQFIPNNDHLSIGFRTSAGQPILNAPKDILFYPTLSQTANDFKRRMEFPMGKDDIDNACVAITIAYYPPERAKGTLKFSGFKVFRKADETFHFPKGPGPDNENYGTEAITPITKKIEQKTKAKAFELILEIDNNGEKSGTFSSDGKGMVIATPNNGVIPD